MVDVEPRADGLLLDFENRLGTRQRRAAPPLANRAAIASVGRLLLVQWAIEQQRIGIQPFGRPLGLRDQEAVANEASRRDLELADLDRIGAADRQAHQRPRLVRRADRALELPTDALGSAERV